MLRNSSLSGSFNPEPSPYPGLLHVRIKRVPTFVASLRLDVRSSKLNDVAFFAFTDVTCVLSDIRELNLTKFGRLSGATASPTNRQV